MTRTRAAIVAVAITLIVLGVLAFEIVATRPVRGAMRTCSELLAIARTIDPHQPKNQVSILLEAARPLCSSRYLRTHHLAVAGEGGIVGIPRNINKDFKAWREGPNVWICPTNLGSRRPVYQFVLEDGRWRFDGPVGILYPWGEVVPMSEHPDEE